MKQFVRRTSVCVSVLVLALALVGSPLAADEHEAKDIKKVLFGILDAANGGDADSLGRFFHKDVTVIHSGVIIRGWDAYQAKVLPAQFDTVARGVTAPYTVSDLAINVDGNTAFATYSFQLEAQTKTGRQQVAGLGTVIFRKDKEGWKVIHTQSEGRPLNSTDEVRAVFDGIQDAANRQDAEALSQYFHEDVTITHSGITIQGWDAYREKVLEAQFATVADGIVDPYRIGDLSINVEGNMAFATYSFKLAGVAESGENQNVAGRGTVVFRNGADGWKVVHTQSEGQPVR
jgi:ketosteroid isomerase-like protein